MASRLSFFAMHIIQLILFAISLAGYALADRVETRDGSILYGSILEVMDGNLSLETTYSSVLKIPMSEVSSLSSSETLAIRDENNNTLSGQTVPLPKGTLNLRNRDGTKRLKYQNVQHLWPVRGMDPVVAEELALEESLRLKWENSLGFDLAGSSGNTDSLGIGLRVDSVLSNRDKELDAYLAHNTQTTNGTTDVEETKFGAEYDSIFRDGLAWYLRSDFEHDPVENIEIRLTGALGLKYDWIKREAYQISTRGGAALRYEQSTLAAIGSTHDPALDLGLDYSHQINDSLALESELSFVPSLEDLTDYLFHHDLALYFPIDLENSWKLRSGLSGTYNSTPSTSLEKADFKYYLRIIYEFQ